MILSSAVSAGIIVVALAAAFWTFWGPWLKGQWLKVGEKYKHLCHDHARGEKGTAESGWKIGTVKLSGLGLKGKIFSKRVSGAKHC